MRFAVPLAVLAYLIKKNPFYRTYPIMLPIMVATWFILFYRMVKYSKRTNNMVHQILLDPTGVELTFIYKNQLARKLRTDMPEARMLVSQMMNPPQGGQYKPLAGDLFPE